MNIPSVRAAVMTRPRAPIEIREFPKPELEPGAILLETILSEVCGTDVHLHQGHLAGVPYPIIPGHVSVGRVGWPVAPSAGPIFTKAPRGNAVVKLHHVRLSASRVPLAFTARTCQ